MKILDWAIENAEKLGTIAILIIVIWGLIYVIKILHKQSRDCESARLKDSNERSQLNKKLGALESKVETLSKLEVKINTLEQLNQQVLVETLRGKNATTK